MAGYVDSGINDGIYNVGSGSSTTYTISKAGTYNFNVPSGNITSVLLASGSFGPNLQPAIRIVDIGGVFNAGAPTVVSGAAGAGYTFNGAQSLSLTTAYDVYTGVIYSGSNFISL